MSMARRVNRQIDDVVVAFTHADDAAGAGADAGLFDVLNGRDAVVIGVGGDNFRMVLAAGIEVMIDPADADVFERADFVFVHQAQRAADVHAGFCADLAHGLGDFVNFFVRRAAAAVDDAEAHGAGFFGLLARLRRAFPWT